MKEASALGGHKTLLWLQVLYYILVYELQVFKVCGRNEATELHQRIETALAHEEISHLIIFCCGSEAGGPLVPGVALVVPFFQHKCLIGFLEVQFQLSNDFGDDYAGKNKN